MRADKKFNIVTHSENCVGCRLCQMRCSFRFTERFSFSNAIINIEWDEEHCCYDINFGDECDQCGLCVAVCVYEALTFIKEDFREVRAV